VPNPTSGSSLLGFSLARSGPATLTVFDLLGRQLKRWSWADLAAGPHQVTWDGRGDDGRRAAAGVLFCRLEAAGRVAQRRMVRLR